MTEIVVKNKEKMPWFDLALTLVVVSCEALTANIITPFVTEMVSSRFGISQNWVGLASGFSFSFFIFIFI